MSTLAGYESTPQADIDKWLAAGGSMGGGSPAPSAPRPPTTASTFASVLNTEEAQQRARGWTPAPPKPRPAPRPVAPRSTPPRFGPR
jgi:hypothetical protein